MKAMDTKRITAWFLAAVMVIASALLPGGLPWLKAKNAVAASTVYSLDPADSISGIDKKGEIAEGVYGTSDFFTLTGKATRGNSDTYSFELAKAGQGSLGFTLTSSADITVTASSTGGGNESQFVLKKDGEAVKADGLTDGIVSVMDSSATNITYTGVSAGSYVLTSAPDFSARGVRIINVVVEAAATETLFVLDPSEHLTEIEKKAGIPTGVYGTGGYFTLEGTATRGNSDTYSFELAKNVGGKISFTVTGSADVLVMATSTGGSNESHLSLLSADGACTPDGEESSEMVVIGTESQVFSYSALPAGTYSFVSSPDFTGRGVRILGIDVLQRSSGERPPRKDWSLVTAPVITDITTNSSGKIEVSYDMVTGYDGADKVEVVFKGIDNNESATVNGSEGKAIFAPASSGSFMITAVASRGEEAVKESEGTQYDYLLPLKKSSILSVYNKGNGMVNIEWTAVDEADGYEVSYSCTGSEEHSGSFLVGPPITSMDIADLLFGRSYEFYITTIRGDESTVSDTATLVITEEAQTKWGYIVYGNGANTNNAAYSGDVNTDGKVTLRSGKVDETGKLTGSGNNGKWMPDSNDGINFYYTEVPASLNFTLRAKVHVDQWNYNNGQEAFGIMAGDKLGGNGWNNTVAAAVTKVEYSVVDVIDEDGKVVSQKFLPKTSGLTSYSHKLGIQAQSKTGLTADMFEATGEPSSDTAKVLAAGYANDRYVLEQRFNESGNLIGNSVNNTSVIDGSNITDMYLTVQKNNTGYFVTYETPDGSYSVTKKYYDPAALSVLDPENVYVGFFTSRYVQATFSDITFTTIDPKDDAPAEARPVEEIPLTARFVSPFATGIADYTLRFSANCDGKLFIGSENGLALAEKDITAGEPIDVLVTTLSDGENNFRYEFTPDADYVPGEYQKMASYEPVEGIFTVTFETFGIEGSSLYVAPDANGTGSREDPMNIYDAVRFVRPGQYIIVMEGTYKLSKTVRVERGINGTKDDPIIMTADPEASSRPVFDFQKECAGMIFAGNYWIVKGFDVTNSADGQKGIQISGNNNILDGINAYHNGNTGIQISRLLASDEYDMWPAENIILNCTSYGNADSGYEDADGFAAKLTVGDGNIFTGCIAYNNADDGWDLYAKIQSGRIGSVHIINCVAYGNGYLEDGTNAGNGNGFKLGGDSMPGGHVIAECVAFNNKTKGIDSNSCPDITVQNCTSFNNGSYNVAMYTKTAVDTAYDLSGVLSYRNASLEAALAMGEMLEGKGTQAADKIHNATNFFCNGGLSTNTENMAASESWFVTTDTTFDPVTCTFNKDVITRNEDGSIDMHGILVLTDAAPENIGATIVGIPSFVIDDIPAFVYSYKVLEGADQVIAKGGKASSLRIDAPYTDLECVKVDDAVVDPENYEAKEGSTIITFTDSYIGSLAEGKHLVRVEFKDGYSETYLTISEEGSQPTGDMTGVMQIIALMAAAFAGIIRFRRKEQ
ncbi:MAG: right-handed parallel beta-helix repeat-containing protein [Lachnospiraceae bacterium]|nr:right-handed parallel beta-helix repeat-containing protein [Lachnospiraceae bacterium]